MEATDILLVTVLLDGIKVEVEMGEVIEQTGYLEYQLYSRKPLAWRVENGEWQNDPKVAGEILDKGTQVYSDTEEPLDYPYLSKNNWF
jgi:hypothetical protein